MRGVKRQMKTFVLALGAGMVAGATVALMLPKNCAVRRATQQAADKLEDAVQKATGCTCN